MSQVHGEPNATPINARGGGSGGAGGESKVAGQAPVENESKSSSSMASSTTTSSFGVPSEDNEGVNTEDDNNEEVQSEIASLSALEDALPIERGLSKYYNGKSKSFGNLKDAKDLPVKKIEKKENPVNRKRRMRIAEKMKKQGRLCDNDGFSSSSSAMPHLPAQNEQQDDEDDGLVFFLDDDHEDGDDDE